MKRGAGTLINKQGGALIYKAVSIGAEATIGIFPTEDGGKQFDARAGASSGVFGWGYVVRVKVPG